MNGSWRTSTSAWVQLLIVALTAVATLLTGQEITPDQAGAIEDAARTVGLSWNQQLVLAVGTVAVVVTNTLGLFKARDDKVTSEEARARR